MEDKEIRKILLKCNITSNLQGYFYIIDAVNIIEKQKIHTNITTIYEMLGKKYEKRPSQVERAIRTAIQKSYKKVNILDKIYKKIPGNSVFIYDLVFNFDIIKEAIENE